MRICLLCLNRWGGRRLFSSPKCSIGLNLSLFNVFLRESEEALESITSSIKRSFAESTAPGCKGPTERNRFGPQSGLLTYRNPQSTPSRKTTAAVTAVACSETEAAAIGHQKYYRHHSSTTSQFEKVMSEMDTIFNRLLKEDLGKLKILAIANSIQISTRFSIVEMDL